MNEYPSHKHPDGKPAATRRRSGGATGLRSLSGPSAIRAALWLFLFSAPLRAFGTERNGSTFTPGSLGDFGMAVVSTNAGLYLRNDTIYYRGSDSRSVGVGQSKLDLDLVAWADSVKLIWVPGVTVLGAQYAGAVNLALINAHVDSALFKANAEPGVQPAYRSGSQTTFGDIYVTPVVLSWKCGPVHLAWAEMVTIPSGTYDRDEFVNVSRNYWALDSQIALTWFPPPSGLEISVKGGFIVNDRNCATDYRTGSEVHLEGLVAQQLTKRLSLGAVWYYYDQVSSDTGSGAVSGGTSGQAFGAGPALRYSLPLSSSRNLVLTAKWLHEFHAQDRFQGDYLYACLGFRF